MYVRHVNDPFETARCTLENCSFISTHKLFIHFHTDIFEIERNIVQFSRVASNLSKHEQLSYARGKKKVFELLPQLIIFFYGDLVQCFVFPSCSFGGPQVLMLHIVKQRCLYKNLAPLFSFKSGEQF